MAFAFVPDGPRSGRSYSVNAATFGSAYQRSQYPPQSSRFPTIEENGLEVSQPGSQRIRPLEKGDEAGLQRDLLQNYECENDEITSFDAEPQIRTSRQNRSKVLIKRTLRTSLQATTDVEREITVLCAAVDPSIPVLIESLELSDVIWTIKEYRKLESISDLVRLNGPVPEEILKTTLNQLFAGLASLFMAGYAPIHINERNICFDDDSQVVITDLQFACEYGNDKVGDIYAPTQEKYGEDIYTAPEAFSSITYNARKAVVWSCGVLLVSPTATLVASNYLQKQYFMATGQTEKLSNLNHPSFDSIRPAAEQLQFSTNRRLSSAAKNITIIHYPSATRLTVPNYVRWILPRMLTSDPARRAELIELATRVPKDYEGKDARPLIELAWLDYKSHVGPYAGLYNPETGGWNNASSASSIYSMVSQMSNPFASLISKARDRRKSAPMPHRPGSSSQPRW